MSVQLKTMAIKSRLANHIRKTLYKKKIDKISNEDKVKLFDEIFQLNNVMHWELKDYKEKRRDKARLLQQRLAAPQTKSMKKKLGLIPRTPKINLENKN